MRRRVAALFLAGAGVLGGWGCAPPAWYEGGLELQRQQCYRNPNPADVQRCLERVNGQTYDDYRKAREKSGDEASVPK